MTGIVLHYGTLFLCKHHPHLHQPINTCIITTAPPYPPDCPPLPAGLPAHCPRLPPIARWSRTRIVQNFLRSTTMVTQHQSHFTLIYYKDFTTFLEYLKKMLLLTQYTCSIHFYWSFTQINISWLISLYTPQSFKSGY